MVIFYNEIRLYHKLIIKTRKLIILESFISSNLSLLFLTEKKCIIWFIFFICFKYQAILLKSMKAEQDEIYRWLIECNMEKLNLDLLIQFDKSLPDDKILNQYQELKENIDELDTSEQFLVTVRILIYFIF